MRDQTEPCADLATADAAMAEIDVGAREIRWGQVKAKLGGCPWP